MPGPNRFHPDTDTQARSAQFVDSNGNFRGKATGATGSLRLASDTGNLLLILPTTDPLVTGALWNNAGTITIS